jgi:hypothetical protein
VQVNISARHGELSATTQEKISEKVRKLPKFFDRLTAIHVTVDLAHKEKPNVELRVTAEHAEDFVAVRRWMRSFTRSKSNFVNTKRRLRGIVLPGTGTPKPRSKPNRASSKEPRA